jgi:hypothetical protein
MTLEHAVGNEARVLASSVPRFSRSWRTGAVPEVLDEITEPSVNLALWQRSIPHGIGGALMDWSHRTTGSTDVLNAARYDLGPFLSGVHGSAHGWLLADIAMLVGRFVSHARALRFRLFFGPVRSDQCRKFHVDHLRMRLVTTYVGPATEWVPDEAVSREAMDHPPDCPCDANRRVVRDPDAVRYARAGDVLLMKGATHGGVLGAVHRSPPIECERHVRIVLVASTVETAS